MMPMGDSKTESVKKYYERTAKDYDKQYETPHGKLYAEITWENIKQFLPKRKKALILDAGGGTGYWAIRLAKHGYRVVLTDISEKMLKLARQKIEKEKLKDNVETRNVDIRDMSCFASNSFDMAIAEGDPVSYCLNGEKAVRELARVVKEDAYVIVSVDCRYTTIHRVLIPQLIQEDFSEQASNRLLRFLRTGILRRDFESQTFTPEELKALFETCRLKVIRMIGKPILTELIPTEKRDETVKNHFRRILRLELKLCDNPSLVGVGGHLEIVGVKHAL
jgi:ubiquinone/menaquinone biosynthesis C-methylase UbiE